MAYIKDLVDHSHHERRAWAREKKQRAAAENRTRANNNFANKVIKAIQKAGLKPYIYHESCYNSVYVKFHDLKHSLRIGDHFGRDYPYKYQIGPHLETGTDMAGHNDCCEVNLFHSDDLELLIKLLKEDKSCQM